MQPRCWQPLQRAGNLELLSQEDLDKYLALDLPSSPSFPPCPLKGVGALALLPLEQFVIIRILWVSAPPTHSLLSIFLF